MAANGTRRSVALCLLLLLTGCTAGISRQALSRVTYTGTFAALQKNPEVHENEVVLLGGEILETRASTASSEVAVLELPLGRGGRPLDLDSSAGRFLIRTDRFLDPAVYRKGTLLTVVGRLSGRELRPIGGFNYAYPVLEAMEIKLWPQAEPSYPACHFGFGIGTSF